MEINKFKKVGKNKYKIFFDNEEITLYEDIILKYDLLLKKDIDVYLLDKMINENNYYEAYYSALNYIDIKMRNELEISNYLSKKDIDKDTIKTIIKRLKTLGLINDNKYIEAFINDKINLSDDGPYKIKSLLTSYNFDELLIDKYLSKIDNIVWKNKLNHIIEKRSKLMKTKSYYMFITKLKTDLYNLGYESDLIDELLSNIKYNSNALENDYKKAIKKYTNDSTKVYSYLLRKGYSYEEINNIIKNI